VPAPWGQTGLAICYDLRFPELFRRYAVGGACGLALSAEWPSRRAAHWQTLLRARAIENQCFVFGANCVGPVFNEQFGGCSAAVSPWGEVLVEGSSSSEELLITEIDTEALEQARSFLPVFQDRRPDLY
jgi:omega-amidase